MGTDESAGRVAARKTHTVILAVRYVSVEVSILLCRLLWMAAWFLFQLLCSAGGQVLSIARGGSGKVHELAPGKIEEAKESLSPEAKEEEQVNDAEGCQQDGTGATDCSKDGPEENGGSTADGEDLILQRLLLPEPDPTPEAMDSTRRKLNKAVAQVRALGHQGHQRVRFSVQVDSERPASIAVLGGASSVREACEALAAHVDFEMQERTLKELFLVHFTMRESWDLPQDDELVEASIANDWVDLGTEGGEASTSGCNAEEGRTGDGVAPQKSPQAVLRERLQEVFNERDDVQIFMDDNPFATKQKTAVRVDFAGHLPDAWDAVSRVVLACEARGVFLSRRFEVLFWSPIDLHERLEGQVESALSHCEGAPERISRGSSGFGLTGCDMSGFEDLSVNVSAVLSGHTPPGWHRMEWTPHGAGAVPHLTY